MEASAIRTEGLTKRYGAVAALDHLDLNITQGEVVGFLGPNGAGKTTTIRLLLGLIHPTQGGAVDFRSRLAALRQLKRTGGWPSFLARQTCGHPSPAAKPCTCSDAYTVTSTVPIAMN